MGEVVWLRGAEQQTWRALLRMRRDLDRAIERQLAASGLSAADFALLVPLSEAPGIGCGSAIWVERQAGTAAAFPTTFDVWNSALW